MRHLSLVLVLTFAASGCGGSTTASDDIVARVDGSDITAAELEKQYQSRIAGAEQAPSADEAQELKLQLLNQLINDRILLDMAGKSNLTATDAEVDVRFNEFKAQYTEEKFQEQLKEQKMTVDDVKAEIRRTVTVEKLINKEITSKISVSDAEITAFYDKNKEQFNLPESYRIAHVLVTPVPEPDLRNGKSDDARTAEDARGKSLRVLREIQGGVDFATAARDYSEDPSSGPNGGDLGFQPLAQMENVDPRLARAVQSLKVGETVRAPVETRFGFHIVKLLEKDAGGQKDLSDPRVQSQVREVIRNRKDQILKAAFSETARNRAKITNFLAERILAGSAS